MQAVKALLMVIRNYVPSKGTGVGTESNQEAKEPGRSVLLTLTGSSGPAASSPAGLVQPALP